MTQVFNLTENEFKAAVALVKSCLHNMGGKRPSSLDNDPFTWVDITDLIEAGWSKAEARGTFSALMDKGVVSGNKREANLTEKAYRWLDTKWDEIQQGR